MQKTVNTTIPAALIDMNAHQMERVRQLAQTMGEEFSRGYNKGFGIGWDDCLRFITHGIRSTASISDVIRDAEEASAQFLRNAR